MGEIERVVLSLSAGKLCKDVLPPKQLSQTLHNIERQLPGNYSMVNEYILSNIDSIFRGNIMIIMMITMYILTTHETTWCQFHQCSMYSFCARRSRKRKKCS